MSGNNMTKEFLGLLDSYKIDKTKDLIKEIGDIIDKDIDISNGQYFFNKQEIIWNNEFLLELEKWEKFKTEKGFTPKKLKDRISKKIKEFLGAGESEIDVVKRLKSLKLSMGIESFSRSQITLKFIKKWIRKTKEIELKYRPNIWLDWASANAKNISFATHVAKLTHSSIKGATNIYFDKVDKEPFFFSTSSLLEKATDVSQTDSKLSPVGKFLQLEVNNIKMADKLKKEDMSDLESFSTNEEQLVFWKENFNGAFKDTRPSSHFLAKQMYFPIDNGYHMISPLVSSSLEQVLYEKIQYSKYKESKKNREQKKNSKYHKEVNIWYPKLAILKVTGSNHTNASPLNGKRGGIRYLFPSTPPQWESTLKPPLNYTSLFRGEYERRVWKQTKELQEYLLKIKDNNPNMYIRDNVRRNINWIIDTLFNYVAEIQNLKELSGWSQEEGRLKESHRLWLDPYCEDELFQAKRATKEWQDEVCLDFGLWLNKKLEHKEMLFVKINSDRWAKILKGRLREFERDLEVSR
jgi:CRISPR-associated protein Csy1